MRSLGINGWFKVFEPSLVKDSTGTVSLPMKRGTGMCKLAKFEGGASAYGIFVSLLPIAMGANPRGVLAYSDKDGPKAHDADSLSLVTGFASTTIEQAIELLLEIGWLEWVEYEVGAPKKNVPKLEDFINGLGGKLTHNSVSLLDEWTAAVKGMAPSKVRDVFHKTSPGIQYPNEFKRARMALGL